MAKQMPVLSLCNCGSYTKRHWIWPVKSSKVQNHHSQLPNPKCSTGEISFREAIRSTNVVACFLKL